MAVAALEQVISGEGLEIFEIDNIQCKDYLQSMSLLQKAFDLSFEEVKDIGEKIEKGLEPRTMVHEVQN